jgi:S1-C subfamily serine protease
MRVLSIVSILSIFLFSSCGVSWFGEELESGTVEEAVVEEPTVEKTAELEVSDQEEDQNPAKRLMDASVTIYVYDKYGNQLSLGSGFFVKSNLIATNFHVVEGGKLFKIVSNSDKEKYKASVFRIDDTHDLALLEIDESPDLKPLKIQSDYPEQGSDIFVMGSPAGYPGTISKGIVSALRKFEPYNYSLIQIDAAISPGSSGGPVVNKKGEVIGITVSTLDIPNAQNLNFAVPTKYLEFLMRD